MALRSLPSPLLSAPTVLASPPWLCVLLRDPCSNRRRAGAFFELTLMVALSLVAMLGAGQAQAEWVDIGGKIQNGLTIYRVYVDPDNIDRNGNVVTLWALFDYMRIQSIVGGPWLSSKAQRQFDCAEKRIRLLGYMTFTGNMGSGEPVFSNSQESKWEPVAEDSIDSKLWEVACSKK